MFLSFFFLFFNLRIYLFLFIYDSQREREREAETQAEGEAGSMHREPDVGFDPGSPGSHPGLLFLSTLVILRPHHSTDLS